MADESLEIPAKVGHIFREDQGSPVRGGHSRFVPLVPVGDKGDTMPCIWKSHYTIQAELSDGSKVPARECLLLVSRKPLLTMRAEISEDSFQHFGEVLVEW